MTMHTGHFVRTLVAAFLAVIAMTGGLPAFAQNQFDLNQLQPGQLVLNLNTNAETSVPQDTLNVMISFTAQSREADELQDKVNAVIREARDLLGKTDNIEYTIQGYRVYMVQPERTDRNYVDNPVWRAQQSIQMHSLNSEALLVVTARLQRLGLAMDNMYYSLSDSRHQEEADALLVAALQNLQAQAESVAAALGKDKAELVEVNVNVGQNFNKRAPAAMMMGVRSEAMMVDMAVPVAEPGESQVNVNISARALVSE